MSLEDPIFIELILGITLKPPLLARQALANLFLPRANLPPVSLASNQQVLLVQSQPPPRGERLVNLERLTHRPNDIGVRVMNPYQPVPKSNQNPLRDSSH